MSEFHYKAKKNSAGAETVNGQITAQNQDEAIELISQMGLLPISIEESSLKKERNALFRSKGIKTKEIYFFSKQLASLIKAGVPILRALGIIKQQIPNAYFKDVIVKIISGIREGKTFSYCLSLYPKIFPSLYIAMIRAGEESGNLDEMLTRIAQYQKSQEEISSKVKTALAYPILMTVVGVGTVFFILTFVMPKFTTLFSSMQATLPLPTLILIRISDFLRKWWMWIALVLLITFLVNRRKRNARVRSSLMNRFNLNWPVVGPFILKVELARFCRTLALLLKSGIPFLRSMQIVIEILSNELIKRELMKSQNDLTSGNSLGKSLKQSQVIPIMMTNLIMVGEESGTIEEVLCDIADSYEEDTKETIKIMTTLLEPVLILSVGSIVGVIVFAMLLPIFQIEIFAQ